MLLAAERYAGKVALHVERFTACGLRPLVNEVQNSQLSWCPAPLHPLCEVRAPLGGSSATAPRAPLSWWTKAYRQTLSSWAGNGALKWAGPGLQQGGCICWVGMGTHPRECLGHAPPPTAGPSLGHLAGPSSQPGQRNVYESFPSSCGPRIPEGQLRPQDGPTAGSFCCGQQPWAHFLALRAARTAAVHSGCLKGADG